MADGLLMKAIKAKAKRKYELSEAGSKATKAGRASAPASKSASVPAGVRKTKAQSKASKEAARKRQAAKVAAAKKKQAANKKKKRKPRVTVLKHNRN